MKKKDIINLIRFYSEGDENGFVQQAMLIADEFYETGDIELANYIQSMLSEASTIVPQENAVKHIGPLNQVPYSKEPLFLPNSIKEELVGIVNAIKRNIGINTFLFYGHPGTGKTKACAQVARLLKRRLWEVSISQLIDSHLGETSKNISSLFDTINEYPFKKTMVVLFDEIDALVLKRDDTRDLREMARATTEFFKGLDRLDSDVVLIATTNMFKQLDAALVRRFDAKINFDAYLKENLVDIGLKLYNHYLNKINGIEDNSRIVSKILEATENLPYPGELKNSIKSSLAFSDPANPNDHLKRLILCFDPNCDFEDMQTIKEKYGFSTRDLGQVMGISKSEIARRIKDGQ